MAPTPTQIALTPKVMRKIVVTDKSITHDAVCSMRLLATTSNSPNKRSGNSVSQNLLHKTELSDIGAVCRSQKALPSRLTAGKAKRTATALNTNPASARLAKD